MDSMKNWILQIYICENEASTLSTFMFFIEIYELIWAFGIIDQIAND